MTPLTVRDRARSFPLDQLLAIRRRGKRICLICGDTDNRFDATACDECFLGTGPMLADPDNLIVLNYGPKP
jgi:hypothetical protein